LCIEPEAHQPPAEKYNLNKSDPSLLRYAGQVRF